MVATYESRLADRYSDLTHALRQAADYLTQHPVDIATRPLRTVSRESGVSPATFTRLSKALDYDGFEEMREEMRTRIGQKVNNFAQRAERLQQGHQGDKTSFVDAHFQACRDNLDGFLDTLDRAQLQQAAARLSKARRVILVGALGSTGIVEYLSYMANFCTTNWMMAARMGSSLGGSFADLDKRDAVIIVTKPPFSDRAIRAAQLAHDLGAYSVVITDTLSCPALRHASASFIVPTSSPHFYSSYVVTLFLVETLIGLVVTQGGTAARAHIAKVENTNRLLAEVWDS